MDEFIRLSKRILIATYLVMLHIAALLYIGGSLLPRFFSFGELRFERPLDPTAETPAPTPLPVPSVLADVPTPLPAPEGQSSAADPASPGSLLIPVAGVTKDKLTDTFSDARSDGRYHDAIDIPAPAGTPVLAAADGYIVKFHDSEAGGITIYQSSRDRRYMFYYAHLQSRAPAIREGDLVTRGTVIGYVGDTGNAGPGNYHLHFSVAMVSDPKRFWDGTNINPYTLLTGQAHLQ